MTKQLVEDTSLVAVADAIRTKGGTTNTLVFPDGFVSAIGNIQSGEKIYNISNNRYKQSLSLNMTTKSNFGYTSISNHSDYILGGNVCVKASNGFYPVGTYYGQCYYKTITLDMADVINSVFAKEMLPDGAYTIYYHIGNMKFRMEDCTITISDGVPQSVSVSPNLIDSNSSISTVYIYITSIIKTT